MSGLTGHFKRTPVSSSVTAMEHVDQTNKELQGQEMIGLSSFPQPSSPEKLSRSWKNYNGKWTKTDGLK